MVAQEAASQKPAAIDTLSVESAGQYFDENAPAPPYARECLITYIDLVTNYERVVFPRPSGTIFDPDPRLPDAPLLARGTGEGWLQKWEGDAAADVEVTDEQFTAEWQRFEGMLMEPQEWNRIFRWAQRSMSVQRADSRSFDDPPGRAVQSYVERNRSALAQLEQRTKYKQGMLTYLFALFARTYQYDQILNGQAEYYPHPFRQRAYKPPTAQAELGMRWSWGRYFVWLANKGTWPRSSILAHIDMVRDECLKSQVTWNNQWKPNMTRAERRELKEKLTAIAWKLELPADTKKDTKKQIKAFSERAGPVGDALAPAVGVPPGTPVATVGLLVGEILLKGLPANFLGRIHILRRVLEWPGLLGDPEDSATP
jgi:hypothetical protein